MKRSKNNKSPKRCLGDLIIVRENRMVIIYGPYIHINVKIYKFNHIPKYSNLIMSAILCKIRE